MKNVWIKLLPARKQQLWMALGFIAAALCVALIWDYKISASQTSSSAQEPEPVETASTFIPEGHVLVPIEVANFESLDSILGKFGVVDLFVPSPDPQGRPRKLAERVKILRAPLNPSHFAVLVPDSESQNIVAYSGALTVVVQNPHKSGSSLVMPDEGEGRRRRQARRSRVNVEVSYVDIR